ncbi:hypothetical protein [Mariniflexile sp.]|uniref:hypothetical protein n=1 Tax=Mariniflexile sp. TaxID=1979402 RepID=UPI0040476A17
MKKCIYMLIISIGLWSCDDENNWRSVANVVPTVPEQVYPTDNLLCLENPITFKWTASTDFEGYEVKYELEIASDRQFSQIVKNVKDITTTSATVSLDRNKAYYWRVRAMDVENDPSTYSVTYQFYTEAFGVSNYLPFSPLLVSPIMDTTVSGTTSTLSWSAKDVDVDDTLVYDVYFGTQNPPVTLKSSALTSTSLNVDVNAATNYYWMVVVDDQKGGKTRGQVWRFKTQ